METIENESQKLKDTIKVGFYVCSYMGLTFNYETFNSLYQCYRNFKNSIFLVYDITKANFGMNPLHAFRFSEKTIDSFEKS